jgi:drug/metabolite transporter (DMT)-like permease
VKWNRGPFRPTWHKVLGGGLILLGVAVFFINDFSPDMLPGAHNELYAVLAMFLAASSVWWFGWFDRPPDDRNYRR